MLLQGKPLSPKDPRALYFSSFLAGADEFVSEHRSGEYDRYQVPVIRLLSLLTHFFGIFLYAYEGKSGIKFV